MQGDVQIGGESSPNNGQNDFDEDFLRGLDSILGPMKQAGASQEEIDSVTERARQFYLSRKGMTSSNESARVDRIERLQEPVTEQSTDTTTQAPEQTRGAVLAPEVTSGSDDQPPYPLSFDQLAELIATGAHIPGIREIPDKINEAEPSEAVLAKGIVKKPWERATATPSSAPPIRREWSAGSSRIGSTY